MKFYCDACNTKYAISDDKVRGKVLKVRCKNCGNVVTVRENRAPAAASSQPPAPTPSARPAAPVAVPTTNWYYALNGETFGPFTIEVLRQRYASAQVSDASYVWHETFTEWKPAATVEVFAEALAKGHAIRPRMQTLGFTGDALEAIKDAAPSDARVGASPQPVARVEKPRVEQPRRETPAPARAAAPAKPARAAREALNTPSLPPSVKERATRPTLDRPSPKPKSFSPATPEARPLQDARNDKLERLRERLTADSSNPLAAIEAPPVATERPAVERPAAVTPKPATPTPVTADASDRLDTAIDPLPKPLSGGAVLTFAPSVSPQRPKPADDAIDFNFGDAAAAPAAQRQSSPSSTSDILDLPTVQPGAPAPSFDEQPGNVRTDISDLFPEAPKLRGTKGAVNASNQTSESLLVELSSLQKQGRAKRMAGLAVAAVALLGVLGLGAYQFSRQPPTSDVAPAPAATGASQQRDELVIRRYSRDDQNKIAMMELEEELLFEEDEAQAGEGAIAAPPEDSREVAAAVRRADASPTLSAAPKTESEKNSKPAPQKTSSASKPEIKANTGAAVAAPKESASAPEEPQTEKDLVNSLLQPRASVAINRPKDTLREQAEATVGLSKDEARKGFKRVKDSVRICRERHNRHNAQLAAQKIKVGVKVQPTGKVSDFNVEPKSVQNTEFDRCMQSHKDRWRFSSFQGEPVVINTSIVLQ